MAQVTELFAIFAVLFIVQFVVLVAINMMRKEKVYRHVRYILITSYLVVLINLTLSPIISNPSSVDWSMVPYNLTPFKSVMGAINHFYYVVGVRNIVGNLVLLLPLAIFVRNRDFKYALLTGFLISLSIESLQLVMTKMGIIYHRTFDVDDLILNTVGYFVGAFVNRRVIDSLGWSAQKKK